MNRVQQHAQEEAQIEGAIVISFSFNRITSMAGQLSGQEETYGQCVS